MSNGSGQMTPFQESGPFLVVALLTAVVVGTGGAPRPQFRDSGPLVLSGAEFPDYDAEVLRAERNGLVNKSLSMRLSRQPGVAEVADLLQQNRIDDALRVLQSIIKNAPQDIPRAIESVVEQSSRFSDMARGYPESLQEVVDAARQQLPRLSREESARAERQLLLIDRHAPAEQRSTADRLRAFVRQYEGTDTALLAEVDVIAFGLRIREQLPALDRVVRDHPETVVAAKALFQKGFQLGSGNVYPDVEARGADPTARFLQVLEIVRELESGRYPPCEWVTRAPSLVTMFFAYQPTYAPGSIDRILDGYTQFVKTHFVLSDEYPLGTGTGYIIATKMFDLFKLKGDGVAGIEGVLSELEREADNPSAVQFLRARFYVRSIDWEPADQRAVFHQKAAASLSQLQAGGQSLFHRKALATLASLYFAEGEYVNARAAFQRYLSAYPETAWAWVAALRIGQCNESLGETRAAIDAHLSAASTYATNPLAYVLGHVYAARNYERRGQFDLASHEYGIALAGWDKEFGRVYSLHRTRNSRSRGAPTVVDGPEITDTALAGRTAQLKNSLATTGGTLLERGRWSVEHERHADAVAPLEQLLTRYPRSPAVAEARYLLHRARLGNALQLADVANPKPNTSAALAELGRVMSDRYDFGVCASKIARASMLFAMGAAAEAESHMRLALMEWLQHQRPDRDRPRNDLQQDIAGIRSAILTYRARDARLRPPSPELFVVVNPDVLVRFRGSESRTQTVYQSVPSTARVIFLNAEEQHILNDIVGKLGKKATQDQPAGKDVLELWNRFFSTQYMFGGMRSDDRVPVVFETSPIIAEIEFLDAGRRNAAARLRFGHEGGTLLLEKIQGIWTAKSMVDNWIS